MIVHAYNPELKGLRQKDPMPPARLSATARPVRYPRIKNGHRWPLTHLISTRSPLEERYHAS